MNSQEWFYGMPGEDIHGPLPIETIHAAVTAGRLAPTVNLGKSASGPWAPLAVVSKIGDQAFGASGKKRAAAIAASKKPAGSQRRSVCGFIEAIGYLIIGIGILCIFGMFFAMATGSANVFQFVILAISNLVSGLMFLAVAEVLRHLGEISNALRNR
jgi:hypothetical protein